MTELLETTAARRPGAMALQGLVRRSRAGAQVQGEEGRAVARVVARAGLDGAAPRDPCAASPARFTPPATLREMAAV